MNIGFVPLRGGSKSIPRKNIKPLNGKPLCWWVISALNESPLIDKIVVATDDDEIEETVKMFGFEKLSVFRRGRETSTDTASTESVMLEYIQSSSHKGDDVFLLAQATSPFTTPEHVNEALEMFIDGKYDSLLSVTNVKRFIWSSDGEPLNYDFRNRPRRQDFKGLLLENGALYASSIRAILDSKCRLSGRVGVYQMREESTAFEIDEPEDWIIAENLTRNKNS